MSLEDQVAMLTVATGDLTSIIEGKVAEWDAAVQSAVETVPRTKLDLYVDAISGDDANSGTSAAQPLASMDAVFGCVPVGGVADIHVLSDITITRNCSTQGRRVRMLGSRFFQANGRKPQVRFRAYAETNSGQSYLSCFVFTKGGSLEFSQCELVLPTGTEVPIDSGPACPITTYAFSDGGVCALILSDCQVTDPDGDNVNGTIFTGSVAAWSIMAFNSTFPAGKLIYGTAAGTDPVAVNRHVFASNVTSA